MHLFLLPFFCIIFITPLYGSYSKPIHTDDSLKITRVDTVAVGQFVRMKTGDTFPDFYFYNLAGDKFGTDSIFKGKPVMFVTGSYSCPIFRYNTKRMYRDMCKKAKKYDIYFVYLREAHPLKGSPYGRRRDSTAQNNRANILITQQKYISERISCAGKTKRDFKIISKVLVDNENNDFFNKITASPNGYAVFSANKVLIHQRTWYQRKGAIKHPKRLSKMDEKIKW